jgi:SAM-dependent methyltransferase
VSLDLYGPEFFAGRSSMVYPSAEAVVPLIIEELHPQDVIDIGCGQGEWVKTFWRAGIDAFGVDIAAPDEDGFCRYDLMEPLFFDPPFDVALCLETGEHLPESAADTLVETCVANAPKVVFSAAVPGQEGLGHINCQPHEYCHENFASHGYQMTDPFRKRLQSDSRVKPWYSNNIFLYGVA